VLFIFTVFFVSSFIEEFIEFILVFKLSLLRSVRCLLDSKSNANIYLKLNEPALAHGFFIDKVRVFSKFLFKYKIKI
jgi:hypothetical protein